MEAFAWTEYLVHELVRRDGAPYCLCGAHAYMQTKSRYPHPGVESIYVCGSTRLPMPHDTDADGNPLLTVSGWRWNVEPR